MENRIFIVMFCPLVLVDENFMHIQGIEEPNKVWDVLPDSWIKFQHITTSVLSRKGELVVFSPFGELVRY